MPFTRQEAAGLVWAVKEAGARQPVRSALSTAVSKLQVLLPATGLQQRLFKAGGRLIQHAWYFVLRLAESALTGSLFRQTLGRIERLAWHST